MDDLVLKPLQMANSCYGAPQDDTNLATAYWNGVTPSPQWHEFAELAAAGLWTTPTDLLRVIQAVQKSLKGGEDTFLKPATAKLMLTEVRSSMALSWVAPKDPGTFFSHTGSNDPGYRCFFAGFADLADEKREFPIEDCGIAIMTNSSTGFLPAAVAAKTIYFLKHWSETAVMSESSTFITPLKSLKSQVNPAWQMWEGAWSDDWTIEAGEDGEPQARWSDMQPVKLLPAAFCPKLSKDGESLDLVLDGLRSMMRLTWKEGNRSIEYCDNLAFKVTELSRAGS
jgi:CubicO group peptidase (beta-lactamase class C family)